MIRTIIKIDEEKCNGCGLCVEACHEGAIGMVDGKAVLLKDDYCDGLGDCLPACPTRAISFEEREAADYDEAAVKLRQQNKHNSKQEKPSTGCPGMQLRSFEQKEVPAKAVFSEKTSIDSQLRQWPIQIKLLPPNAPYFKDANLLIAADCTAYAYGDFHNQFIKNKITLIGCPKLDEGDYAEKLTDILKGNDIKSITVVRMEVPCCGGIVSAVTSALKQSGKIIPWQVVTITRDGKILG